MAFDRRSVKTIPTDLNALDGFSAHEIAELWVQLTDAASTDLEAKAFLAMFEPWAKAHLGSPS